MKKILITSVNADTKGFKGEVAIVYGEAGIGVNAAPQILKVDFSGANLTDEQANYILKYVPRRYMGDFGNSWGQGLLRFFEADMEVDFYKDFYWPYDNALNLERCLQSWKRMSKTDRIKAAFAVIGYNWHLSQYQWKNKMNPHTFLRDKCYNTDWYSVQP